MLQSIKRYTAQESLQSRMERMALAALYGALIATLYTWSLALVNVIIFPNLPMGIDLPRTLGMWKGFAVGAVLVGTVSGWFTEEHEGIIGSGIVATVLLAILLLVTSKARSSTLIARSILTALPLIGAAALGGWLLRWAARQHMELVHEGHRWKLIRYVLIIALIGLVPGILGRMDLTDELQLKEMNQLLQTAAVDPSARARLPLDMVPGLESHFGMDYRLYAHRSAQMVGNLDVTVRYTDGYVMTCSLLVSASNATFITDCKEGS